MVVLETVRSREARALGVTSSWLSELERFDTPARELDELVDAVHALEAAEDPSFIAAVHRALSGRDPDPASIRDCHEYLGAGASRLDVVRRLAVAPEARSRGVDSGALMRRLGEPDPGSCLRRLWRLPDDRFLRFVYYAVLGREPDPTGFAGYLKQLTDGRSRLAVVREVATSEEAGRRGGESEWLDRLEADPPAEPGRLAGRLSAAAAALGSRAGRTRRRSGSRR
jgi:Domain of unknown function (DUF4214)